MSAFRPKLYTKGALVDRQEDASRRYAISMKSVVQGATNPYSKH